MKNTKTQNITFIALMTALICVVGPFSVPIGPVPISLANLAILITVYAIGMKRGTIAVLLYLLIGLIGIPVFSGFSGGPQKLFGPTGGYLIGYVFLALIAGWIIDRYYENRIISMVGMIAGTAVLYVLGTAWLAYQAGMTFQAALAAGVIPFIAGDLLKMVCAAVVGPMIRHRLSNAGFLTYKLEK